MLIADRQLSDNDALPLNGWCTRRDRAESLQIVALTGGDKKRDLLGVKMSVMEVDGYATLKTPPEVVITQTRARAMRPMIGTARAPRMLLICRQSEWTLLDVMIVF